MDARWYRAALLAAAVVSCGASYRTENFLVEAPTPAIAEQVGREAERFRHELAVEWLGQPLPRWSQPCPISVQVGPQLGAGGATSFVFDRGEVFGWQMSIQGSLERVLDSVLPHEVTHTVFATHFRQPLPRWADEGACTTVEHPSEVAKQQRMLITFLKTGRGIPFSQMFAMKEYPADVLPLYSQGHSLASFLIAQGGKRKFMDYVGAGLETERWGETTREFYGFSNLAVLQDSWLAWVRQGSRLPLDAPATGGPQVLLAGGPAAASATPDRVTPAGAALAVAPSRAEAPLAAAQPAGLAHANVAAATMNPEPSPAAALAVLPGPETPLVPVVVPPQVAALGPTPVAERSQVTRPPTMEPPRQIILEWSRPAGEAPIATVAAPLGPPQSSAPPPGAVQQPAFAGQPGVPGPSSAAAPPSAAGPPSRPSIYTAGGDTALRR